MGLHNIQDKLSRANMTATDRVLETDSGALLGWGTTDGNSVQSWAPGATFHNTSTGSVSTNVGSSTAAIWAGSRFGSQANTAGSGYALSSSLTGVLRSFADDGGVNIGTSVRNIQGRTLLTVDQSGGSIRSVMGQLKMLTGIDVTTGIYTAVQGYVEMAGTHVAQTGATFSCIDASMEITTSLTVDSGGEACGVHIETTGAGTITNNGTCAALLITGASGAAAWPYGIYMNAADCLNGIYLSATTQACEMVVTALPANARGARYAFTCATPAMSDGYGSVEIDLTVSGTATGMATAASTWINVPSGGTLAAGDYACVHNDGVWLDNSATTTSAVIVWSRVQFIFGTNTGYDTLHLFDLNLDIDQNMTSLFNCNNLALAGFTAGAHSSAVSGSIPFIGTGGTVKYIRVHDSAA